MKRFLFGFLTVGSLFAFFHKPTLAQQGCCSWHGGISYCDTSVGTYVCNDGTYSPSCGCAYVPPPAPLFPVSTQATITHEPNRLPKGTFAINVILDDSNPTQYSATLNKCMGCDPGPSIDFRTSTFTFKDITTGRWYLNVKKNINGRWSNTVYWTVDVPPWYEVSPIPIPTPMPTTIIAANNIEGEPTNPLVMGVLFVVGLGFIGVCLITGYKFILWIINYVKENDWIYTVLFWAVVVGIMFFSL